MNMFDTRLMLEMVEQMKKPATFLKDTFFGNVRTFDTAKVDIDIEKGKRKIAPFVHSRIGGKTVERQGFQTNSYSAPLIAPDIITTAEDLLKRSAGENIYGAMSPDERAARQLGKDIVYLDDMITRREEWMCAKALFTGKVNVVGEGIDDVINFGTINGEALAGSAKWSHADSKPLDDFRRFSSKVRQNSGLTPDIAIISSNVVDVFLNNPQIKEFFIKAYRPEFGLIKPENMPNGTSYLGQIISAGVNLDLYAYEEWFVDEATGAEEAMIPDNKVLVASTRARTDMCYGAITIAEGDQLTTYAASRVPNSWTQKKPAARFLSMSSRPIPVPTQIDAFYVATVV